jgi:hypothetical protein
MATTLTKPFNNITLVAGTAVQLVTPAPAHVYFNILNVGAANIAISDASTAALTDPHSYLLPPNLSFTPLVWGPTGIWVEGAGAISVALVPKQ